MIHEWPPSAPAGERPASPPPAREQPRLTREQKGDLARIVVACILTMAALGGAGWFACQGDRLNARQDSPPGPVTPAVTVQTTEVVAAVTTPDLGDVPGTAAPSAGPAAPAPARVVARRPAAPRSTAAPSESLPRRVARFITGDGRHEVRPFPAVPEK
jgi:hypothetical protein